MSQAKDKRIKKLECLLAECARHLDVAPDVFKDARPDLAWFRASEVLVLRVIDAGVTLQ